MPAVVDILILLDEKSVVRQIQFAKHSLSETVRDEVRAWHGTALTKIPDANWDFQEKTLVWQGMRFEFNLFRLNSSTSCLVPRRENLREKLMEAALNAVDDSVQLYDADATIQFYNRAAKKLVDIPPEQNVEGQKMFDYFEVRPDRSTVFHTLRTSKPIRNDFASYKTITGKQLTTLNTTFPVVEDDTLLGCVDFERDMRITKKVFTEWANIQQILTSYLPTDLDSIRNNTHYTLADLIGSDPALLAAIDLATRMAPKDNPILIQGETGTGKEIFAQGIHELSSRRNRKFVAINCAAFPESLIEGMLFGTTKGAFTGSVDRIGLIEEANHGTLFLDELNSMSLPMQAKLLRVLQEKTLQRLGSTTNIPVDVRLISSCNEDALTLSEGGKLRKDLFYRVASVIVAIPPLRERKGDLEALTWDYIKRHQDYMSQPIEEIEPGFWDALRSHDWPGNVRELNHILSYSISVAENGLLRETDFPAYFKTKLTEEKHGAEVPLELRPPEEKPDFTAGLSDMVRSYERHVLEQVYESCGRNATKMAQLLKISRQNCQYYIKKYQLNK